MRPLSRSLEKKINQLSRARGREKYQSVLLEGPHPIESLLSSHSSLSQLRDIIVDQNHIDTYSSLLEQASSQGIYLHHAPSTHFHCIAPRSQGIIALADLFPLITCADLTTTATSHILFGLDIQDPGNAGTIIRTADAAGFDAVLFSPESVDVTSSKVIRSSAGSIFHTRVGYDSFDSIVSFGKQEKMNLFAATASGQWDVRVLMRSALENDLLGTASSYPDIRHASIWFVGNEAHGFANVDISALQTVSIPILGRAESLNVSTASALCMYMHVLIGNK